MTPTGGNHSTSEEPELESIRVHTPRRNFLLGATSLGAVGLTQPHSKAQADVRTAQLLAHMDGLSGTDTPFMGAVLVSHRGVDLVRRGYGHANVEHQVANTADTPFKIGSISKTMTALALFILVSEGKASIGDPLQKHLPRCPATWSEVRLAHLLNHTSGIPDIVRLPGMEERIRRETTLDRTIESVRDLPLDFPTGAQAVYGNTGFIIAARVIELLSGATFADYLDRAIYRPLGMLRSGYAGNEVIIPDRASGYAVRNGRLRNADFIDMSLPLGAGAQYSTLTDLQRYWTAVRTSALLPEHLTGAMLAPGLGGYAMPWAIEEIEGRTRISHIGDINGFGAFLAAYPEDDLVVAVLSNLERTPVKSISADLERIAFSRR
jgi:CubicO group peptidase (beta-lactamase class C family)